MRKKNSGIQNYLMDMKRRQNMECPDTGIRDMECQELHRDTECRIHRDTECQVFTGIRNAGFFTRLWYARILTRLRNAGSHRFRNAGILTEYGMPGSSPSWNAGILTELRNAGIFTELRNAGIFTRLWHAGIFTRLRNAGFSTRIRNARIFTRIRNARIFTRIRNARIFARARNARIFARTRNARIFARARNARSSPGHGNTGFPPGGQQQGSRPPTAPPPNTAPAYPSNQLYAVDPGAISGCLYRNTYVWLSRRNGFWFYPTYVGRTSVSGYRWNARFRRWEYYGVDLNNIESFTCY